MKDTNVNATTDSELRFKEIARLQVIDDAACASSYCCSMAGDGNTLVVGNYNATSEGFVNSGAVYIYINNGAVWELQARLQASDPATDAYFGCSCALSTDGNTLVVGSDSATSGGFSVAGAIYIFTRSGEVWEQQARLQASNPNTDAYFGYSCAINGNADTMVVGAHNAISGGISGAGAAYIFTKVGGVWVDQARLQSSSPVVSAQFGSSCSISSDGNTIAVGANFDTSEGSAYAGAAYIFTKSATGWAQEARLQASDSSVSWHFGYSCSVSGDGSRLVVGGYDATNVGFTTAAAYIFTRNVKVWTQDAKLKTSDTAAIPYFGVSCSTPGYDNTLSTMASVDEASEDVASLDTSEGYTLVVGTYGDYNVGCYGEGNKYIFS